MSSEIFRCPRKYKFLLLVLPIFGAGLVSFIACSFGMAQGANVKPLDEIRARALVIEDEKGNELSRLGQLGDGSNGFVFWNTKRDVAVSIRLDKLGLPMFAFEKEGGTLPLLEMGLTETFTPVFVMRNTDGARRLAMMLMESGVITAAMFDKDKRDRCVLTVNPGGEPQFVMRDTEGRARIRVGVDQNGDAEVLLKGRTGDSGISLTMSADGKGRILIRASDGTVVWRANPE